MFMELPSQQVQEAVEATAKEVLSEAGVFEPPVDAMLVAQRLGMVVVRDGPANTRARFVRLQGSLRCQNVILLADEPRPERRYWAIAHEIGEFAAARVFASLGTSLLDEVDSARERIANRLAGCLLLPQEWFAQDGVACDWDLLELKQIYASASHELIARRMLEMTPSVVITLFDQRRPVWRRSNCLNRSPRITDVERAVWRAAHRQARPARCERMRLPECVDDIRAWPIHEPQWQREIVRTEIADCW